MDKAAFVAELAKLRPSSTFLNLHNYRNEEGEVAHFNIIFHISYENALKKSIAILESVVPESKVQAQAKRQCIDSLERSLINAQTIPIADIDDAYTRFFDEQGSYIKGIKMHTSSTTLHLYGLVHQKLIVHPVSYKKTTSSPLTIAKNKLRRMCPVSRFRQFKVVPDQVEFISVQGLHLLPPGN